MTHDLTDKGMARIWQEEFAAHKLAGLVGCLSFGFALDQAVAAMSTRIREAAYEVDDAMVARAEQVWWNSNINTPDESRAAMRAALTAALSKPLEKDTT